MGRRFGHGGRYRRSLVSRGNLLDQAATARAVADDWFWGYVPPAIVTVDYSWLVQSLRMRPDPPTNDVTTRLTSGGYARVTSSTSVSTYGTFTGSPVTLDALNTVDAAAYGTYITAYYGDPRQRIPQLTFDLLQLTDLQRQTVLGVQLGQRVAIANVSSTWPAGCNSVIVEGIGHSISVDTRQVAWNISPVIGTAADAVGPWFTWDVSFLNSTIDLVPY